MRPAREAAQKGRAHISELTSRSSHLGAHGDLPYRTDCPDTGQSKRRAVPGPASTSDLQLHRDQRSCLGSLASVMPAAKSSTKSCASRAIETRPSSTTRPTRASDGPAGRSGDGRAVEGDIKGEIRAWVLKRENG